MRPAPQPGRSGVVVFLLLLTPWVAQVGTAQETQECETLGTAPDSLWRERPPHQRSFLPGEKLTFSVQYGLISAGTATMTVS